MSDGYLKSHGKILIDYEAINEIVLGAVGVMMVGVLGFDPMTLHFTYHAAICGILTMLKGCLLLHGIKKENRICVMVHILLSVLSLLLYKAVVIYVALYTPMIIQSYTDSMFITVYFVFFPLFFGFSWYIQFCAFRFYQYLGAQAAAKYVYFERLM
ncbi:hypothetical protein Zmor_016100 [Zophobas morio]|uniref:Uncharacterized protein n=1 Tax=Zophobas morio TaxID=2755281 RepID=A0AA38MI60_9CUCU|nr:hypothetical protein Zmor_016100 [Zophobas morio]